MYMMWCSTGLRVCYIDKFAPLFWNLRKMTPKKKNTHYLVDPSNHEITSGNTYHILYVLDKERTFSSRVATTIQIVALIMNHLAIQGWANVPMKHHPTIEDIILNRYLKVKFNIPPKELLSLSTPAILQSYHVPHLRMLNSSSAFSRKACSFNTAPTNWGNIEQRNNTFEHTWTCMTFWFI